MSHGLDTNNFESRTMNDNKLHMKKKVFLLLVRGGEEVEKK